MTVSPGRARRHFCGLLALGLMSLTGSQAHAAPRVEGQALVRWSALSPRILPPSGDVSRAARAPLALQSAMRMALPGASVKRTFAATGWSLVELPRGTGTDVGLGRLRASLGASNVQPNTLYHLNATPNDAEFGEQNWLQTIQAPAAWNKTVGAAGSSGPIIALIDAGVQLDHPDLQANLWVNEREIAGNGRDDDRNGYIDDVHGISTADGELNRPPSDDNGHGTHVAGILGAVGNNGRGVTGVNWQTRILPLRFIGSGGEGSDASIIEALEYIIALKKRGQNIRVTSNSYSGPGQNNALDEAFRAVGKLGILNVCAAGNGSFGGNGFNIDQRPEYPAAQDDPSILAVAASDENDNLASFSNFGARSVDIAAPGVNILSLGLNGTTSTQTGTSMSTPMVAGAAALLLSVESGLTHVELKARLLETADKVPGLSGRVASGGRLNVGALIATTNQSYILAGQVFGTAQGVRSPLAGAAIKVGKQVLAYTDLNGRYSIVDIQPGTYALSTSYKGFNFRSTKVPILSRGVTTWNFEGVGKGRFYSLSGRAIGPDGTGVAGVEIFNTPTSPAPLAVTDSGGFYRIDNRTSGTYRLTARGAGINWTSSPTALKLPVKRGVVAPNGEVNFLAPGVVASPLKTPGSSAGSS